MATKEARLAALRAERNAINKKWRREVNAIYEKWLPEWGALTAKIRELEAEMD